MPRFPQGGRAEAFLRVQVCLQLCFNLPVQPLQSPPQVVWLAVNTQASRIQITFLAPSNETKIVTEVVGAWILPIPRGPVSVFLQDHLTE